MPIELNDGQLGLRPLTARSVLASMLLGTHPPRLPVRVLVAAAGLFGISEGTARTALSRMVSAGDVVATAVDDDSWYGLGPELIERQRSQDVGREASRLPWDGTWRTLIVVADRRRAAARTAARTALTDERFAELRGGVWVRPANLSHGSGLSELLADGWVDGRMVFAAPVSVEELWPMADRQQRASALIAAVDGLTPGFEAGRRDMLAEGFMMAAAVLRHFRTDPLLPEELLPEELLPGEANGANIAELRLRYDRFDQAYRRVLRDFFAETKPRP